MSHSCQFSLNRFDEVSSMITMVGQFMRLNPQYSLTLRMMSGENLKGDACY